MPGFLPLLTTMTFLLAARARSSGSFDYSFSLGLQPVLALLAGVLILIRPKLLNLIVAIYLIVAGLTGLVHISF